ncbi:helix-turn-helix domain-containing protein [Halomonas borealis]|jgi:AraC-like DNA-binding protein|uniref:helix-turn-helix domain-containing protein n=1 Tax=Halomonas borealis TaxID=2508710 RepID=UPI0010A07331|nr:AraC family transcriptional regulator [Halomonas borealis]
MPDPILLASNAALDYHIDWSAHRSSHCINTGWRVLPFWVVLHVWRGKYHCHFDAARPGQPVVAGPGELLVVPAAIRHALTFDPGTTADGLHLDFRLHQNLDVFSLYRVPSLIAGEHATRVGGAVEALTATLARQDNGVAGLVARHAAAYRFLEETLAVSQPLPERERRLIGIERLQPALRLINQRLDQPQRVEDLARHCSLSRNRFSALFKKTLGVNPKAYIDQQRLKQAMSLLVNGEASIAEIAERLGYCDPFHFSKRFKNITGESPRDYRHKIRKTLFR